MSIRSSRHSVPANLTANSRPALLAAAAAVAFSATGAMAQQGRFVVSGDTSIVYNLPGGTFGPPVSDNGLFFSNVLGSGTGVRIYDPGLPAPGSSLLNNWYNSVPGVSSTIVTGTISSSTLSGASLFFVTLPRRTFSTAEVSVIQHFVDSGGTLFVIGEHSGFDPGGNSRANSLLTSLGSSLRISNTFSDPNGQAGWIASPTNGQVVSGPLTPGVNSFVYGGAALSAVSGGQSVFLLRDAVTPFLAYEVIPTPSAAALLGLGGLMAARRRR